MKKAIGFVVVIVLAVGGYFWWQHNMRATVAPLPSPVAVETPPVAEAPPATSTPAAQAPLIQHPIDTPPVEQPLPPIDDSDRLLAQELQPLTGSELWRFIFLPDRLIRHIVATVDNLPRQEASTKVWPVRTAGSWLQTEDGGELILSPANAQRYERYMELVQRVDVVKLAAVYKKFYPLFQRAYVELGYPDGYFNDRLVVTIDDLLAAPELEEPPQLVQNKVLYQYADPALESRSAGQKIMMRIGVANERIVKTKLRALRAAVTKMPAQPASSQLAPPQTVPQQPAR